MRTALITGSRRGIGLACCRYFKSKGWRVLGVDMLPGGDADELVFDLRILHRDPRTGELLFRRIEELLPDGLHALVNNAAVQRVKPSSEMTRADWSDTLDTNLLAPFWLVQRFQPLLRSVRGSVVNIASIHANLTKPGFAAYAASKAALLGLTRSLALELAPEIRVNAVLPAATDTPMLRAGFTDNMDGLEALGGFHPLGRIADPQEVAAAVYFLAAEDSSFITGSVISVDGGIGCRLHDPA